MATARASFGGQNVKRLAPRATPSQGGAAGPMHMESAAVREVVDDMAMNGDEAEETVVPTVEECFDRQGVQTRGRCADKR
jgi:hypothetical protein